MSRSGYSEDYDEAFPNAGALYEHSLGLALTGKRGQSFIRDLVKALDAMPIRRLIANDLIHDGEVCAIGALGVARDIDMSDLDPERPRDVAKRFKIAQCLAREVTFQNDERGNFGYGDEETPEDRWVRMRAWAEHNLKSD